MAKRIFPFLLTGLALAGMWLVGIGIRALTAPIEVANQPNSRAIRSSRLSELVW